MGRLTQVVAMAVVLLLGVAVCTPANAQMEAAAASQQPRVLVFGDALADDGTAQQDGWISKLKATYQGAVEFVNLGASDSNAEGEAWIVAGHHLPCFDHSAFKRWSLHSKMPLHASPLTSSEMMCKQAPSSLSGPCNALRHCLPVSVPPPPPSLLHTPAHSCQCAQLPTLR